MILVLLLSLGGSDLCRFAPVPNGPEPQVWSVPMPVDDPGACVGEFIAADGGRVWARVVGGRLQSDLASVTSPQIECDLTPVQHLTPGTYQLRVSVPHPAGKTMIVRNWPVVVTSGRSESRPRWSAEPRLLGLETISVSYPGEILDEDMILVEVRVEDAAAVRVTALDLESGARLSGTHRVQNDQIAMGYHCQGVHLVEGRAYAVTLSAVDAAGRETPAPGPPLRIEKPESHRWHWLMVGNAPAPATRWWLLGIWGGGAAIVVAVAALLLRRRLKRAST